MISRRKMVAVLSSTVAGAIALYSASTYLVDLIPQENRQQRELVIEVFLDNLQVPWSMAFSPDGRLFFTERPGRIRKAEDGKLSEEPFAKVPVEAVGEGGLLGLALHPEFQKKPYLYIYYTYRGNGDRLSNRVVRYRESNGRAVEPETILDGIPGAGIHDGGRIKFGPDGKLYVTTGDAGVSGVSQDLSSLGGKILRINPDGSIPSDNPMKESPIYSFGHRNPQGLSWHPMTRRLYSSEHGPSGEMMSFAHDEINIIEPGKNYGWPFVIGKGDDARYTNPLLETGNETWAPSGMTFYKDGLMKEWKDNLFVTTLRGEHLHRIVLDPRGLLMEHEERLFHRTFGRLRDVVEGPGGELYVATSNRDGRGIPASNDDRILRISLK